jgi:hypothetical protein
MKTGRKRKLTTKHREACRAGALAAMEKRTTDPTLQELYGPGEPTTDNPHGYGLVKLERMKRPGWNEQER